MKGVRIRSDRNFHWLIGDDVDTTATTLNEHTYDRQVYIHDLHYNKFHKIFPRNVMAFSSIDG